MVVKKRCPDDIKKNISPISLLKTIKNVCFTDREIDIIACLLGGRSYKKIASILSISPKTVEQHLRNIMLKVGCGSRDGIIDFIEKSDKFTLFKNHYTTILAKKTFEQELGKISLVSKKSDVGCLIFHDESQTAKTSFVHHLKHHLIAAGIKTFSKSWMKDKSEKFLANKIGAKQIDCIIYVLSNALIEQFGVEVIYKDASNLVSLLKESSVPIIFLLLDDVPLDTGKDLPDFAFINLSESENYYFLFFELLKKMLPSSSIGTTVARFKKQYEILQNDSILQSESISDDLVVKSEDSKEVSRNKKKNILIWVALFFICFISFSFVIFKINSKINELLTHKIENTSSKINKRGQESIVFNLPSRNNKFTGRNSILLKIKEQLNRQKVGVITQTISGLGGIGKTQLATEFSYKAAEEKEYSVILWVLAETANSMDHTYREFAKSLQLDIRGLGSNKVKSLVHEILIKKHKNSKILFVLDNAPDYENVQDYIRQLNKQLSTNLTLHILITSRNQHWPDKPLLLNAFTQQEALTFAKKHLPDENEKSLIKLIETFHYYPLALSQAVAYIKQHTNADDYLAVYLGKQRDYLSEFAGDKNQYKESLWKTWSIALTKLSSTAKGILFISSYLYPDDIPTEFFSNISIEKRGEAIKDLRKHSFIILTNSNKSFKIHRLLQEVIRNSLALSTKNDTAKERRAILVKAADLLRNKFNFSFRTIKKWKSCGQYLTHARTLAEHMIASGEEFFYVKGVQLYSQIAMYLTYAQQDDYEKAKEIFEKIIVLLKQRYSSDKSLKFVLANIATHLGLIARQKSDIELAKKYLEEAALVYQHEKISNLSVNMKEFLSYLRWDQGSVFDEGKSDYGYTLYNLGLVKHDSAEYKSAKDYYKKALELIDKCKQTNNTILYRISLLLALGNLYKNYECKIKESENVLSSAIKISAKNFPGHLKQAFGHEYIANLFYYVGLHDKAKENIEKCLQIRSSILPKDHYRIGVVKSILGLITCSNNDVDECIMHLKQAEDIYNKNLRKGHRHFIFLYLYMSYAFELYREYDVALQYIIKAQKVAKEYWDKKPYTALSRCLSPAEKLLISVDTSKEAMNYYIQALDITKEMFGKDHIRTARYHYLLGQAFEDGRNKTKARYHYQQALDIAQKQHFDYELLQTKHQENIKAIKDRLEKGGKKSSWLNKHKTNSP